jgi:hypothetical protein
MANDPNWNLPTVPSFTLTSPDFSDGDTLPQWARSGIAGAGGEDRSPTLHWEGAPSGTRSFALTVYDPDAPTGSGFWHWAVYNIPAEIASLPADAGNPDLDLLPSSAITLPSGSSIRTRRAPVRLHGHSARHLGTVGSGGRDARSTRVHHARQRHRASSARRSIGDAVAVLVSRADDEAS